MGHKWPPLGRQASPGPFRPPEASPKSIRPPQKPPQEKSWGCFLGPNMRLTPLIWSTFDQNNSMHIDTKYPPPRMPTVTVHSFMTDFNPKSGGFKRTSK